MKYLTQILDKRVISPERASVWCDTETLLPNVMISRPSILYPERIGEEWPRKRHRPETDRVR